MLLALRSNGGGTPLSSSPPPSFFSPSAANEFIDENAPDNAVFNASRCSSDRIGSFFPGLPDLRSDDSDESRV